MYDFYPISPVLFSTPPMFLPPPSSSAWPLFLKLFPPPSSHIHVFMQSIIFNYCCHYVHLFQTNQLGLRSHPQEHSFSGNHWLPTALCLVCLMKCSCFHAVMSTGMVFTGRVQATTQLKVVGVLPVLFSDILSQQPSWFSGWYNVIFSNKIQLRFKIETRSFGFMLFIF